jgi:hypothetical protein
MATGDSGQGINVGDAVLTFLGDTTQLDQAFDRIATQAEVKMAKAADSVSQVGDAADDAGASMTAAGASSEASSEKIVESMGQSRRATAEARGEAALLGEAFGIHLPRHVRSFVAELPGIGTALSAAFSVTAVLFLIEALANGVEKIQEWAQHAHQVALAWDEFDTSVASSFRGLDDKLLEAGIKMDELKGDHIDALRKQLELIDHVSMRELEQQFNLLAKAADAMFAEFSASWYTFDAGSKGAKNALTDFKAQYDLLLAEGKNKEAADLLAGTAKSAQKALDTMKAAKAEAEEVAKLSAETAGAEPSPAGGPTEKELQAQEALVRVLNAQIEAQKKINELASDDTFIKRSEEAKRAAEEQATEEKRALDQQLANIETWKSQQHAAYEAGKIDAAVWRVAELQATDAATIAHESYLQKLVDLYQRSGQAVKAHAAAEQLATLQTKDAAEATDKLATAMEKHRSAAAKVREEYGRLLNENVVKQFEATAKAAEKLTAADDELLKAQSKLAEDNLTQHYKDQEAAITKLAEMHLITESQKDDRLKLLEQQQANAAIAILDQQLAKEEAAVAAAAKRIEQMKLSPSVSTAEVIEAEANLKKLETAVVNTESQIVAAKEKFNKQSEADDKSHYGRALLIAMAAGNERLAEQLKENHALLLTAEGELATAKARGLNTAAIEKEIAALKQNETQLEKETAGAKSATLEKQKFIQQALLAAQAELAEAKARGLDTIALEQEIKYLQQLEKLLQLAPPQMQKMQIAGQNLRVGMQQLGQQLKQVGQEMENAMASAIMSAIEGQKSVGAALEAATKQILQQLGQQCMAKAIFYTAQGIGFAATPGMEGFAPGSFEAAAIYAACGAACGVAAAAMSAGGSGGSSGNQAPQAGQVQMGGGGGGGSQQTGGVTKLAAGGIVSQPTMFMAGDSAAGGAAEEAILPLSDPDAMRKIASAILPALTGFPSMAYGQLAAVDKPRFDAAKADVSDPVPNDFGTPTMTTRPSFDFSQTPLPREMPNMQALAAQFGGLLSVPTLRAASGNQASVAAAADRAPAVFDQAAMEKLAGRMADSGRMTSDKPADGGGDQIHVHVKGMISPDNLNKVVKKINRAVQNRQITLKASDSLRVTRRSQ